jgi:hypothetical protein
MKQDFFPPGRNQDHVKRLAAVLALIVGATVAPAAAAPIASVDSVQSPCMYFYVYSLTVEAQPRKKVYTRGETIKIDFTVTRPGPEDPGGNNVGLPEGSPSTPAEGVEVHASFWAGNFYRYGKSITDPEGKAVVKIKTDTAMPASIIDLDVSGHVYYNRGGCPDGEEAGYNSYPKAFTLR